MKKILAFLLALCLLCSVTVASAESIDSPDIEKDTVISCTVPSSHKITVEGVNAKVKIEGKEADSFDVNRLQSPKLHIVAEKGYVIKKVIYDGVDVTAKLKDGYFTAEGIFQDCALIVETEKSPTASGGAPATGDTSNIYLWIVIFLVSIGIVFLVATHKKRIQQK